MVCNDSHNLVLHMHFSQIIQTGKYKTSFNHSDKNCLSILNNRANLLART